MIRYRTYLAQCAPYLRARAALLPHERQALTQNHLVALRYRRPEEHLVRSSGGLEPYGLTREHRRAKSSAEGQQSAGIVIADGPRQQITHHAIGAKTVENGPIEPCLGGGRRIRMNRI